MNRNSLFFIQRSFCSISLVTIWTISPYFLHFSIEPWTPGLIINRCSGKKPSLFPRETKPKVVRATETPRLWFAYFSLFLLGWLVSLTSAGSFLFKCFVSFFLIVYTSVQSKNRSANRFILSSYYIVSFWLNKKLVIFGEVNRDVPFFFCSLKTMLPW